MDLWTFITQAFFFFLIHSPGRKPSIPHSQSAISCPRAWIPEGGFVKKKGWGGEEGKREKTSCRASGIWSLQYGFSLYFFNILHHSFVYILYFPPHVRTCHERLWNKPSQYFQVSHLQMFLLRFWADTYLPLAYIILAEMSTSTECNFK